MACHVTFTPGSTSERSTSLRRPFIHAIEGHHQLLQRVRFAGKDVRGLAMLVPVRDDPEVQRCGGQLGRVTEGTAVWAIALRDDLAWLDTAPEVVVRGQLHGGPHGPTIRACVQVGCLRVVAMRHWWSPPC